MAKELLTDTALRGIKAGDTRKRLSDGAGLYLLLFVMGGAHGWRLDYSHEGKRKTLSLGTYPVTSLSAVRRKAEEARLPRPNSADRVRLKRVQTQGCRRWAASKRWRPSG